MTAPAVRNTRERDINMFEGVIMRSIIYAAERLFGFKVKYQEWCFGPIFSMLGIQLNATGGPDISGTLAPDVGDPNLRSLELGNSKVKVKSSDQVDAPRSAVQIAAILADGPKAGTRPAVRPHCTIS